MKNEISPTSLKNYYMTNKSTSITYVCGHKNPDTDSVCSAIFYAKFLSEIHQKRKFIPITAGPIVQQTNYILDKFKVAVPEVMTDVSPRAKDIQDTGRRYLKQNDPLCRALNLYNQNQQLDFACVDDQQKYVGMLQLSDMISVFMRPQDEYKLQEIDCTLNSLKDTLGGTIMAQSIDPETLKKYKMVIPTMDQQSIETISAKWDEEKWQKSMFIMGNNIKMANYIIEHHAGVVIFTRSSGITDSMSRVESNSQLDQLAVMAEKAVISDRKYSHPFLSKITANSDKTSIIASPLSVASTVLLVKQSTPVSCLFSKEKIFIIKETTSLRDIKDRFNVHKKVYALAVVDQNGVYKNLIKRYDTEELKLVDLVLVDHNELVQQVNGSQAIGVNIVEIVDHHKIVIDDSMKVQKMTVKPVGCTCTIIFGLYKQKRLQIDKQTASLLMSAILCDTLVLKSPTSTPADEDALKQLSQISGIDYKILGTEIFSSVQGFSGGDNLKTIKQDYKIFDAKQGKYGVSQVEVSSLSQLTDQLLLDLKLVLQNIKKMDGLFFVCCLVTDVQANNSVLLTDGPHDLAQYILYAPWKNDWCFYCPEIVSRKKQLIPHLIHVLASLG